MTLTPMTVPEKLLKLSAFQPSAMPVLSLYLNTQPNQHGRASFDSFLRREFKQAGEQFSARSPERRSFDEDVAHILEWLGKSLRPSANGAAIFACSTLGGVFEALQVDAPVSKNEFHVYRQPHIFGLARLQDRYPLHAVLLADTNSGRTFTFGLGRTFAVETLSNTKIRDMTDVGRWSRAGENSRRHNYRMQHVSELIGQLDQIVRAEQIAYIILAGDDVVLPALRKQLSPYLAERVVASLALDIKAPEHEVRVASQAAIREHDSRNDTDRVRAMLDLYHAGGRAAGGVYDVLAALVNGQVEELFVQPSF